MATALQLTTQYNIINGHGLATSANLTSEISTYQSQTPITLLANIYGLVSGANANVSANIASIVSNVGVGVTQGQWLLDLYPANITPTCTGSITYYEVLTEPIYGFGNVITGNTIVPYTSTASVSNTLLTQANLPFSYGMQGFANVFLNVYTHVSTAFETVASVNMLQNKTYAQSGLGYTNSTDLVTNGINSNGPLLANVISGWGTMYDVNNMATFGDPYVFGQNLINQGLGNYGNLIPQLQAAGLNVNNLKAVPQSTTTTSQTIQDSTVSSPVGPITLPGISSVTTTTTVTGNSPSVLMQIYSSVTGSDLEAIISATGINVTLNSLADYLNYDLVVGASVTGLQTLGISSFNGLGSYLQSKLGTGNFGSWSDIATTMDKLIVPNLAYTPSSQSGSLVLSPSVTSGLNSIYGTGTGPFNNPVITDFIGAVAGVPYASQMQIVNQNYSQVPTTGLVSALTALQTAVENYISSYSFITGESITAVTSAVAAVNTALNSIPASEQLTAGGNAYYTILNSLTNEVANFPKSGATIGAGYSSTLTGFAQSFTTYATDETKFYTYQFFANLITNDSYGDGIRAVVTETFNTQTLNQAGVTTTNDPNPSSVLAQATAQNIPLSTYISQNQ